MIIVMRRFSNSCLTGKAIIWYRERWFINQREVFIL